MKKVNNDIFFEIIKESEISDIHFYWIDFSWLNLSFKVFNDCKFEKCNLSNINLKNTSLNNIEFYKTKILWVNFTEINTFLSHFDFIECSISLSFFMWMKLKSISFIESEVKETDFTNSVLEWVDFSFCNLEKSIFLNTSLKKANLIWAFNFSINPNINSIEKAKFSTSNVVNLLNYLDIIVE